MANSNDLLDDHKIPPTEPSKFARFVASISEWWSYLSWFDKTKFILIFVLFVATTIIDSITENYSFWETIYSGIFLVGISLVLISFGFVIITIVLISLFITPISMLIRAVLGIFINKKHFIKIDLFSSRFLEMKWLNSSFYTTVHLITMLISFGLACSFYK